MSLLSVINQFLWNGPLLLLLLGIHLYFTVHLHVPQRHIGKAIRMSLQPEPAAELPDTASTVPSSQKKTRHRVSPFGALATTLAATLGTGNIIGVSTAVALGGPGAVLWCWLTGVLGMATAYAECYLGVLYRQRDPEGHHIGGPMYVIRDGLRCKPLAGFYALCTVVAAFGVGCTTQANSLTQTTTLTWGLSPHLVGMAAAVVTGLVLIGGIRSISRVCMRLVPVLGFLYIAGCLALLWRFRSALAPACMYILESAFTPQAALGGAAGGGLLLAARYGIARGLYTNEAGIGTSAIGAASSDVSSPTYQAYVSMTAVFWDTVVMCLLTGLVIVANMLLHPDSLAGVNETGLAAAAFRSLPLLSAWGLPIDGEIFLSLSLAAFALTTLIGWSYMGEKATEYLWGPAAIPHYKLVYIVMIYVGAVIPMHLVWECTDLVNAVMVLPNVTALILLRNKIRS
ncbi:MAG: amino acid carrier protein [Acetatifactor sp.]|nr:amino acid carrier protein [Acetatifactor sp.]